MGANWLERLASWLAESADLLQVASAPPVGSIPKNFPPTGAPFVSRLLDSNENSLALALGIGTRKSHCEGRYEQRRALVAAATMMTKSNTLAPATAAHFHRRKFANEPPPCPPLSARGYEIPKDQKSSSSSVTLFRNNTTLIFAQLQKL